MKKRYFLQASAALLGGAVLQGCLPSQSSELSESKTELSNQFAVSKTEDEWREVLTPEEFGVLRQAKTEAPRSSPLDKNYTAGTYSCAGCSQPLYSSETKFDSGTGWPSFYAALDGAVATSVDRSFMMTRTEVHCSNCGGHLGHIFDDGPQPTGKRHCLNGVALKFTAA